MKKAIYYILVFFVVSVSASFAVDGRVGGGWIDSAVSKGLSAIYGSAGYRIAEIERHHHHYDRWLEAAASPSGETDIADRIGSGNGYFEIDAGDSSVTPTWGDWVQIIGSLDTPVISGSVYYDFHGIDVEAAERTAMYYIQFAFGESAAAALSADNVTDFVYQANSVQSRSEAVVVSSRRQSAGTKVWARCLCPGQNTGYIRFIVGIHEYEG